ncbi:MAG: hypothetical protein ABEJ22_06375 [Haloferacaceae archaeon]
MFDVPLDAWYTWVGLALASAVVFGTAYALPTAPPPDAGGVADTVDRVASAEYAASAERPLHAAEVRLGPSRVDLRDDGGSDAASFAFGPVTPVARGTKLRRVLDGAPPPAVFDSKRAFREALSAARERPRRWRPVDGPLTVRRLSWGDVSVTLVGA